MGGVPRRGGEHAEASWEHLSRSHSASTEKGRELLGYSPGTSLDAARAAVEAMGLLPRS